MDSTPNPEQTDPRNAFARVNDEIARVYEQIALADEQIAQTRAQHAARHPPAAVNNVKVPRDRPLFARPAVRGVVGLLLTVCIGGTAIAWQSPYGDVAKQIISRWAPQLVLTSWPPPEKPRFPAQQSPPAVQVAGAETAAPQLAPLVQTAAEGVAPTAAALSPESAQLLQSTARDLANVEQDIEQLKASIALLNATVERLKTSQEKMSRDIAKASQVKASEQSLRPKISAPPPRPTATQTRKPVPTLSSPQARAQQQDEPTPRHR